MSARWEHWGKGVVGMPEETKTKRRRKKKRKTPKVRKGSFRRLLRVQRLCDDLITYALRLQHQSRAITDKIIAAHFKVSLAQAKEKMDNCCTMGYSRVIKKSGSYNTYEMLPPVREVQGRVVRPEAVYFSLNCGHTVNVTIPTLGERTPGDVRLIRCAHCLKDVIESIVNPKKKEVSTDAAGEVQADEEVPGQEGSGSIQSADVQLESPE